ncbi:hypothetical protein XHC_2466 [Xanthomonas hortorum pv. carotae str. M081]|nr:hypothetical protein XHC_2466 [Xanthomonas hortorum pv. carotae str. M081]
MMKGVMGLLICLTTHTDVVACERFFSHPRSNRAMWRMSAV